MDSTVRLNVPEGQSLVDVVKQDLDAGFNPRTDAAHYYYFSNCKVVEMQPFNRMLIACVHISHNEASGISPFNGPLKQEYRTEGVFVDYASGRFLGYKNVELKPYAINPNLIDELMEALKERGYAEVECTNFTHNKTKAGV
tara:strand:- start:19668 stop:20090 length:423 start_codon:yes stop_codon:yes gene_type:complete